MNQQIELTQFLLENEKWLKNISKTAEIIVEGKIIRIISIKGFKFESIIPRYLELNDKTLHFLGLLTGDSCSKKQTSAKFGLSNTNLRLIKEAREQLEKTFFQPIGKIKMRVKFNKKLSDNLLNELAIFLNLNPNNISHVINTTCKQINFELFVNNRPLKRIVFNLLIPKIDLLIKKDSLLPFLTGLLEADGTVRRDYIAITVGSQEELEIINKIIKKVFHLSPHILVRKGKKAWDLRIYGVENVQKILSKINTFSQQNENPNILAQGYRQPVP